MRSTALALAITVAGCTPYHLTADQVRTDLMSLPPTALRQCLGDPLAYEITGAQEDLVFQWGRDPTINLAAVELADGVVRKGAVCRYRVRLEGGRIAHLEATGFTADGLNYDAGCFHELRRCVTD